MNLNVISPYVRVAMTSTLVAPFYINKRIIFDYELIFIEKGKWELILEGKSYICNQSDVILILPNQSHEIKCIDDISVSQPHIHFDMSYDNFSEKVYISFKDYNDFSEEEKLMIRPNIFHDIKLKLPILKIGDIEYFKQLFFNIINIYSSKKNMYELVYKQEMIRLLYCILLENSVQIAPTKLIDNSILSIYQYINNNYISSLTLKSIALLFNYNKYYLDKKFKSAFGMPIVRYYHLLRIHAAKEILLQNLSVTKTAEALSFDSIYSFSRFFKNKTGISPSQYIHLNKKTSII